MEDLKIPIEQLLYSNYIKYDKLSQLVEQNFAGSNATSVNIYIDLYSMSRNVHLNETFNSNTEFAFAASMINLCAHLRYFFRTRYNVETKIFMVYSNNLPEYNKKMWFGYNSSHEKLLYKGNNTTTKLLSINLDILDMIVPYLPDIYVVETDFEVGVMMYDLICFNEAQGNTDPNIILSTDMYLFQLVNMVENTCVFRPKKYKGEDISYVVNRNNLLDIFFSQRTVKIPNFIHELDSGIFSLLLSLSRCPERSVKSFFSIPKASEVIYSGVCGHKILNGYNSNSKNIWNSLYEPSFDKYTFDLFDRRFKVIDILSQYYIYLNASYNTTKLINLVDPDNLKDINNKYFKKFPLDLNRL